MQTTIASGMMTQYTHDGEEENEKLNENTP
jgi:hypothetical protein